MSQAIETTSRAGDLRVTASVGGLTVVGHGVVQCRAGQEVEVDVAHPAEQLTLLLALGERDREPVVEPTVIDPQTLRLVVHGYAKGGRSFGSVEPEFMGEIADRPLYLSWHFRDRLGDSYYLEYVLYVGEAASRA